MRQPGAESDLGRSGADEPHDNDKALEIIHFLPNNSLIDLDLPLVVPQKETSVALPKTLG
jgi:hypothetical protein